MKLLSWNINGIRAAERKGFFDWLQTKPADVICVQETKAHPDQLTEKFLNPPGYHAYWNSAEKKGYSGVAVFILQPEGHGFQTVDEWPSGRIPPNGQKNFGATSFSPLGSTTTQPLNVRMGFGIPEFDGEGRVLELEFTYFTLFNIYFPNGSSGNVRVPYKMAFYEAFFKYAEKLRKKGKRLIICGDVNTAHEAIDLARPKENEKNTGFLPEERGWVSKFISKGYVDTFRAKHPDEPGHYSWWDYKTKARERDVGWRIDYFFVSQELAPKLSHAFMLKDMLGSDHCPVGIDLDIKF